MVEALPGQLHDDHSAYVKWLMSDVHFVNTVLHGNCNAGVTSTNEKGTYGLWEFWLNSQGIANVLSIPPDGKGWL